MAQSWLQVELDLTPPTVQIHAPSILLTKSIEAITIEANEALDTKHSIYIIDSLGTRHDYTFTLEANKNTLFNNINFEDFPNGIATIFVVVYDEVLNKSSLYKKSINIGNVEVEEIENIKLTLETTEKQNEMILNERIAEITIHLN